MQETIIKANGDSITVEAHYITEVKGDVLVYPEETDGVSVLTGNANVTRYEGATIE